MPDHWPKNNYEKIISVGLVGQSITEKTAKIKCNLAKLIINDSQNFVVEKKKKKKVEAWMAHFWGPGLRKEIGARIIKKEKYEENDECGVN